MAGTARLGPVLAFALTATLVVPRAAGAASADLDPTFGAGGSVVTTMGTGYTTLEGLAQQPDGKIIGIGLGYPSTAKADWDFALARYTANGRLDPTFGTGGRVFTDFGLKDSGRAVAVQPDGKIVAVGDSLDADDFEGRLSLARYNPDGTLDPSFGAGGKVVTDLGPGHVDGHAVALAPDGSIVVGGWGVSSIYVPIVMRFRSDGTLDSSFGASGFGAAPLPYYGPVTAVLALADGSILASGWEPHVGMHVYRLTRSGLDPTFGDNGLATANFGAGMTGSSTAMAVLPDGRIVLVGDPVDLGASLLGSPTFAVARFTADGALDTDFSGDGLFDAAVPGADNALAVDVAAAADGTVTVAGIAAQSGWTATESFLARLTPAGALDPGFGTGGIRTIGDYENHPFWAASRLVASPDGRLVVAGFVEDPNYVTAGWGLLRFRVPLEGAKGWGWNPVGQLGDGTVTDRQSPVAIGGVTAGVTQLSGGAYHSVALGTDGSVEAWGWNGAGQLGDGTTVDRRTAVVVAGPGSANQVAAGGLHTLVLGRDGTVWSWGWNGVGQLGNGTTTDGHSPAPVPLSGRPAQSIAAGTYHSLAALADGTVATWGWNAVGQLGDGTTRDHPAAVTVPGLTSVVAVAGGTYHSLALRSDGTVWAWGYNGQGELGDGTTTNRFRPVQVPGLTDVVAISAGMLHSLALRADGTVWAWGYNGQGQLGDGTTTNRSRPIAVTGLTGVASVAAGGLHSLAATADGLVSAWGWNGVGQLGDGTTTDRLVPVTVHDATGDRVIGAGAGHSLG